jgi:hypothetical protein
MPSTLLFLLWASGTSGNSPASHRHQDTVELKDKVRTQCGGGGNIEVWVCLCVQLLDSIEETENYETYEDDKVGEFWKCVWVPGELKSGLGYQGTLVSLSLLLDSEDLWIEDGQ